MSEEQKKQYYETEQAMLMYEIASSWLSANVSIPFIQRWLAKYYVKKVRRKLQAYIQLQNSGKKTL